MKRTLLAAFALSLITAVPAVAQEPRPEPMVLRIIALRTETEARDVLTRLQGGGQFEELARRFSVDSSARGGGYVGPVVIGELKRELQEALKGLAPGQVSQITRAGGEYLLLRLERDEGAQRIGLIEAVTEGKTAQLKALLASGANANARFDDGSTLLMAAAYLGQADAVRLLLDARADRNATLADGSTILIKAALAGHSEIVRALVDAGAAVNAKANNGLTALMQAAFGGHLETARILVKAGADVNATLENGSTALMAAALRGHAEIVRTLVDAGADVRARSKTGSTALTEAVYAGHLDAAHILLKAGADVNASLENGSNALMAASLAGRTEIVRALLDAGADMRAKDKRGWTALTHAAASSDSATLHLLLGRPDAGIGPLEAAVLLGGTYVNEFYSSREANLLESAATELQKALALDPQNLGALQWMAAVEFLRWDEQPDLSAFRRVNALLSKCAVLDPLEPDRHYWIAAANWIFASRGKGSSSAERAVILDEGIEHAGKAAELDPSSAEALEYLNLLYRLKADQAATPAERDQLLRTADATRQQALRVREKRAGRPARPDDQFSKPAPPPPPE